MSITDELRKVTKSHTNKELYAVVEADTLLDIADRIDEAHEREVTMARGEAVAELGNKVAREYVKLPVDADGVSIHVGDKLDGYNETTVVQGLTLDSDYWSMTCENGLWFDLAAFTHHKDTVEDVLREFALACEDAGNASPEVERIAADYADRIREAVRDE